MLRGNKGVSLIEIICAIALVGVSSLLAAQPVLQTESARNLAFTRWQVQLVAEGVADTIASLGKPDLTTLVTNQPSCAAYAPPGNTIGCQTTSNTDANGSWLTQWLVPGKVLGIQYQVSLSQTAADGTVTQLTTMPADINTTEVLISVQVTYQRFATAPSEPFSWSKKIANY